MKTSRNAVFGNASVAVLRLCERKMLVLEKKRKELCENRDVRYLPSAADSRPLGRQQELLITSSRLSVSLPPVPDIFFLVPYLHLHVAPSLPPAIPPSVPLTFG